MDSTQNIELGLVGWPVAHSLSPVIHAAALKAANLDGRYRLYPVPPLPEGKSAMEKLLGRMRSGEIQGINVTIPHKQSVIPFLNGLTTEAQDIGAVNTLMFQGGRLVGDNTDARGFLNDLKQKIPTAKAGQKALVLGAGGAARAVVYALSRDGWQVTVAARRQEQAEELASDLSRESYPEILTIPLNTTALISARSDLLVNATPVGMAPFEQASPWPADLALPTDCFLYDLVYNPKVTRLIKLARKFGLPACSGLGMLVEQAALSFEIWTQTPVPRTHMYQAIEKHMEAIHQPQEVEHGA